MLGDSINIPALTWSTVAAVGLLICLMAAYDAHKDLLYLQAKGLNGARELVAWGALRGELLRVAVQLIFLGMGIVALDAPQVNSEQSVTLTRVVIASGLILASGLLVLISWLAQRDRRRLVRMLTATRHQWDGSERRGNGGAT